ncbi:UNVERIFIED_CONTAM: hypothetical protein FKN15_035572 [Acipenser sinensis]
MPNDEVQKRFRLDRAAIFDLCEELKGDLESQTTRSHAIPVHINIQMALGFYITGSFQRPGGNLYGVNQPTMSRVLHQVTEALVRQTITFLSREHSNGSYKTRKLFFTIGSFPSVLGAIACTHVPLRKPTEGVAVYINRKGVSSINVQLVCDATCSIITVCANFPGSCHDSYILSLSSIYRLFEGDRPPDGVLLGDAGYGLRKWLMTPFAVTQNRAQEAYNEAHAATRNVIERTFGALQYAPKRVCDITVTCCVLHNIAVQRQILEDFEEEPCEQQPHEPQGFFRGHRGGRRKRILCPSREGRSHCRHRNRHRGERSRNRGEWSRHRGERSRQTGEEQTQRGEEQTQTGEEQTQRGAEQTQTGEEQTQRGEEQTQSGEEQTQRGEEQTQRREEQTQRGEEQTQRGEEQTQRGEEQTQRRGADTGGFFRGHRGGRRKRILCPSREGRSHCRHRNRHRGERSRNRGEWSRHRGERSRQTGEEQTQRGEEQTQTGEEQTQRGAEQTQRGEEQTQRGEEQTQRGEEQTQSGEEQTQRGEEQTQLAMYKEYSSLQG